VSVCVGGEGRVVRRRFVVVGDLRNYVKCQVKLCASPTVRDCEKFCPKIEPHVVWEVTRRQSGLNAANGDAVCEMKQDDSPKQIRNYAFDTACWRRCLLLHPPTWWVRRRGSHEAATSTPPLKPLSTNGDASAFHSTQPIATIIYCRYHSVGSSGPLSPEPRIAPDTISQRLGAAIASMDT